MNKSRAPWQWIPSLYFAEGLPNIIVTYIALVMYKRLGLSNAEAALYTSWLYLPWVIKPFWSPVVDILRTKRWWILLMQLFIGFYMLELPTKEQALYVGIRSTFYRVSTIAGQGLLLMIAGVLEVYTRRPIQAWSYTFAIAAFVFLLLLAYHHYALPRPKADLPSAIQKKEIGKAFLATFISFFRKPHFWAAIAFMLLYRLPEALLTKVCPLFLVDPVSEGGLGLTTSEVGFVQGTIGIIGLTVGGVLGGIAVSRDGLKRWLWFMVMAISLPDILYVLLAYFQPEGIHLTAICIFIEQFGYGFGFTAYMLYLISYAQGPSKTAHYAFATGFMALSMMLPGLFAGYLSDLMGYLNFFILVMLLVPVTFIVSVFIKTEGNTNK